MVAVSLWKKLADARFDANLIAVYGVIVVVMLISLFAQRRLSRDPGRPRRWTGFQWLESLGLEAAEQARKMIWWATSGAIVLLSLGGLGYHLAGRDVRVDLGRWLDRFTTAELTQVGIDLASCVALFLVARFGVRIIRWGRPRVQTHATTRLASFGNGEAVERWFALLERFAVAAVRLWAIWMAACVMGLEYLADVTIGFILRVVTLLVVARLLTLALRVLTRAAAALGNEHLNRGRLRRYWERFHGLIPFGERCFDWGIYVLAASWSLRMLIHVTFGPLKSLGDPNQSEAAQALSELVPIIRSGPRVFHCLVLFFLARVGIEMLQVLLYDVFNLHDDDGEGDAKGRTLVPLLHSVCQYVLYIGAGVMMLDHLGVNVLPILTGLGVAGLAIGLGAQSLVNDVVSGFFILFDGQFLVGDYIQIGDASGIVEEVGIRNTKIRDAQGKLYIIPNGQIKGIISYSKGYVNAVVDVKVPAAEVEEYLRAMTEAGHRLKHLQKDVLADTVVQGLVDLGTSDMTIRAVTKVRPGRHRYAENEYRRILRAILDELKRPAVKAA